MTTHIQTNILTPSLETKHFAADSDSDTNACGNTTQLLHHPQNILLARLFPTGCTCSQFLFIKTII